MEDILDEEFSFKQFLNSMDIDPEKEYCNSLTARFKHLTII